MKKIIQPYPLVAIVGRTNVGKSTIFNRLTEKDQAITSNIPGTTRDERLGPCTWGAATVMLSDTAGLDVVSDHEIDIESLKKARGAIAKADLLIFVVDVRDGVLPQDKELAKELKKSGRQTILVINKVDANRHLNHTAEFYQLGFKDVFAISAKSGAGTGDLLDLVVDKLKNVKKESQLIDLEQKYDNEIKIALIGKPNVGKSSLINKIVGEDRAIVSSVPHTTRDSQDITIEYEARAKTEGAEDESLVTGKEKNYRLTFVDTAGIVKRPKIQNKIQKQSIEQSLINIRRSDLVLLLIDAAEDVTTQDKNISREILENGISVVFVVNKWDLIKEKTTHSDKEFTTFLYRHFPYLTWAPVVFTSAKTGFKVERLINVIIEIFENQHKKLTNNEMGAFLKMIIGKQSPRKTKGLTSPYIRNIKQVGQAPLTFEILANEANNLHFSYRRFITNELRQKFGFFGCGIRLRMVEAEPTKRHQTKKVNPLRTVK